MAIVDYQSKRYEYMVGFLKRIVQGRSGDVSSDVRNLPSVGFQSIIYLQWSAWKINQSKKAYAFSSLTDFKCWEVDAKTITQIKADIYKYVGTRTDPGIGLRSSSGSNLREAINFIYY